VKSLEESLIEKGKQLHRRTAEVVKLKQNQTASLNQEAVSIIEGRNIIIEGLIREKKDIILNNNSLKNQNSELTTQITSLIELNKALQEKVETVIACKERDNMQEERNSKIKQIKILKKDSAKQLKQKKQKAIVERLHTGKR